MTLFPENDPEFAAIYAEESAMVESAEVIAAALQRSGVTRKELAERLGVSPAEITQRLQGERNITVRTLASTLHALGAELHITVAWTDTPADGETHAERTHHNHLHRR